MLTLLVFFVTLSILIFVHELGHFLVAKKAGIKVEEFGFGYPPRLFAKKIGETVYSLNWILFGGFVKLYGEELEEKSKVKSQKSKFAFWAKSKKARTAVIIAGVLSNFLLAIICFSVVYTVVGIPTKTGIVKILGISRDSPAEKFGLKEQDIILAIDEEKIDSLEEFTDLVNKKKGLQLKMLVERKAGNLLLFITPRENPPEGEGPLGVIVSNIEMVKYPFWQMPVRGAIEGLKEAFGWGMLILVSLKKMFLELVFRGVLPKDVAGPVGILQVTSSVARQGILTILQFIGILSVNLAVLNILPFPALDGGKLIFVAYELVTRRRPKPSWERWVNTAGMAFLIFLIILVTVNDIVRVIGK